MSRPRLLALLLALATLVLYLPVTRHDFLYYDDDDYVTDNQILQHGLTLDGIKWAFTTFHANNWHPVTWLSHMTDCQFFKLNAGAHHLVSVLFHAANSALLFILLWRLTQKIWPAALVAALFAWHPLHVESVAWVAERKDVLSTFFFLLSLLSYVKSVRQGDRRSFWFAVAFFAIGLMAKPMLVTLPFVLLLLDCWPLERFAPSTFRLRFLFEKWPFIVLAAASCVVTCLAQRTSMGTLEHIPLSFRLENAATATTSYLLAIFYPVNLSAVYPLSQISSASAMMAGAVLLVATIAVWLMRQRNPCCLVGWLWFLGTLVPVVGLVQVGVAARADRYTYIPSIGIFIIVVFGLYPLFAKWVRSQKALLAIPILLLAGCVVLTEVQLRSWRDSETLFRHALAVTNDNWLAHEYLGMALAKQNRSSEALAEYKDSIRLNPYHFTVHFLMGNMLEKLDRPADALAEYRLCLGFDPQAPPLHNAMGNALASQGDVDEALKEFAEAARVAPRYAAPHLGTAKIFFQEGRDAEALVALRAATHAEPDSSSTLATAAHYLAANQNPAARDGQAALALALRANDLAFNNDAGILDILGMACAETGDFTNAVACAQSALDLTNPNDSKTAAAIRQRLVGYQNHQPWRESFAGANPPAKN